MEDRELATLGVAELPHLAVNVNAFSARSTRKESLAEVAHDARNMVTALGVYCDLLDAPGVLTTPHVHLSSDLKIVAATSRRLIDRLTALERESHPESIRSTAVLPAFPTPGSGLSKKDAYWEELPPTPISDLAWELASNRNLLAALAGPSVTVGIESHGGALPVRLNSEDLTRILVNLVKNAVEAMPTGGKILLSLREAPAGPDQNGAVLLNVEDNGNGIPPEALGKIFASGYTTRSASSKDAEALHRGHGLAIVRSIIESAGGAIRAANRDPAGACFQIELPVRGA
jgi:signal transduction histidine kinase